MGLCCGVVLSQGIVHSMASNLGASLSILDLGGICHGDKIEFGHCKLTKKSYAVTQDAAMLFNHEVLYFSIHMADFLLSSGNCLGRLKWGEP